MALQQVKCIICEKGNVTTLVLKPAFFQINGDQYCIYHATHFIQHPPQEKCVQPCRLCSLRDCPFFHKNHYGQTGCVMCGIS